MAGIKMYRCELCGNIAFMLEDNGPVPSCCGQEMTVMEVTTDGSAEKHTPVITEGKDGAYDVAIGEIPHPMMDAHSIHFVIATSDDCVNIHYLHPGEEPKTSFTHGSGDEEVYEWCNLHGLWSTKVK